MNNDLVSLFVSSWITLLQDSPLNPTMKPFQTYRRFLSRMRLLGLKKIIIEFSDLAHKLMSQHYLMGQPTLIGDWIDDFKNTPVFFEYNRYFKTGDPSILNYLYTFLNFGKKLDYVDDNFNEIAFRDWLGIEKRLDDQSLNVNDTSAMKYVISRLLLPFSISDFRPKFGPGSVQERGIKGRIGKIQHFAYDKTIDRFLFHGHIGKYGYGEDSGLKAEKVIPDPSSWDPRRRVSSNIARLIFVPKNIKVSRSICMEPNTTMFFQQGILAEMLKLFDKSPISNFLDIRDQTRNKDLALFGSYTSEIDTLDLSAASDSLSFELVKSIFPNSWQIPMRVTRTPMCYLPNGDLFSLKKFAPMGSALCFPTQCITFVSVCIYAACLYTYEVENVQDDFLSWLPLNYDRVFGLISKYPHQNLKFFQPIAVYGDDICVDRRLTNIIKTILARLSFTVNDAKSFTGSQAFRESCGGFYLNGHDMTPLYFRIKDVRRKLTPNHIASQVHLINECWSRGYKNLYRFLHQSIMTWECSSRFKNKTSTKNSIPYTSNTNIFGIYTPNPKNNHLVTRENIDYQSTEIRAWTITYNSRREPADLSAVDAYEYMRWWSSPSSRLLSEDSSSVSRSDTSGSGLRWRWIPAQ